MRKVNKTSVLELIDECKREVKYALENFELSNEEMESLKKQYDAIEAYRLKFENNVREDDHERINSYYDTFSYLKNDLMKKRIGKETKAIVVSEQPKEDEAKQKITAVIPVEEQEEETIEDRNKLVRNLSRVFLALGAVAAVAIIIAAIKYYVDHPAKKITTDVPTTSQTQTITAPRETTTVAIPVVPETTTTATTTTTTAIEEVIPEIVNLVENVDINNYDELSAYAEQIQDSLKGSNLRIDDIMYAIRMANWDALEDKSCFTDREGVCRSTYNAGLIASELGSDAIIQKDPNTDIFITDEQMKDILICVTDNALTAKDFESAKVEDKGYDIYKVVDVCIAGMNAHKDSNKEEDIAKDRHYARVFNDVATRAIVNFSIVNSEDAPLCTMYNLLGAMNANKQRILDLTKADGPIYGTGPRIDGNYGNLCTLELITLGNIDIEDKNGRGNYIGNQNCIFYSDFIDEVILNPEQSMGSR